MRIVVYLLAAVCATACRKTPAAEVPSDSSREVEAGRTSQDDATHPVGRDDTVPVAPTPPPVKSRFARTGRLEVTSEPAGAVVNLNSSPVGRTPYADSVIPGTYQVDLSLARHRGFTRTVTVTAYHSTQVQARLVCTVGSLAVLSSPGKASVLVDGMLRGTTPLVLENLLEAEYQLLLKHDLCLDATARVLVRAGTSDTVRVNLLNRDSVSAARDAARKKRQWARRVVFGALAAGFAAGGLIANAEVGTRVDTYNEALEKYNAPGLTASEYTARYNAYTDALSEAQDAERVRNILYIIGGVSAVGFTLSIWF